MDKEEKKKKTEQKDELMENDRRYPVEQVSNTGEPTKKEVKAAVKELKPDLNWSPHYEWIEPLLHEFETPVNIIRVNMEGDKKVADAYNIETAPGFVLQRKDRILWKKTGEVFPGELKDVIEMFKN